MAEAAARNTTAVATFVEPLTQSQQLQAGFTNRFGWLIGAEPTLESQLSLKLQLMQERAPRGRRSSRSTSPTITSTRG